MAPATMSAVLAVVTTIAVTNLAAATMCNYASAASKIAAATICLATRMTRMTRMTPTIDVLFAMKPSIHDPSALTVRMAATT